MGTLLSNKTDFAHTCIGHAVLPNPLRAGQVLLTVDCAALTANVFGYAMSGVTMGYFDFFLSSQENEFGVIPSWGMCTVVESQCAFVPVGQRVYGLVPIGAAFVAEPKSAARGAAWVDVSKHRQKRDIVYNSYQITDQDPMYAGLKYERAMILLRPLFTTAWVLRDFALKMNCDALVITSASSKTSASLAGLVKLYKQTNASPFIVGLTSKGNVNYVKSLNFYDKVDVYDSQALVDFPGTRVVVVDMAGNIDVLRNIQNQLKQRCLHVAVVGITHIEKSDMSASLSGEGFDPKYVKPKFFFAPRYIGTLEKESKEDWKTQCGKDWHAFIKSETLTKNTRVTMDIASAQKVYDDFCKNKVPGNVSWVLQLGEVVVPMGGKL